MKHQSIQPLINYSESYLPLEEGEKECLVGRVSRRQVRQRPTVLQERLVCRYHTFVLESCYRLFAVDPEGVEHTTQFVVDNDRSAAR